MRTKHTPGPWTEDGRTGSIWQGTAPVDRKRGLRIAVVDISDESVAEDRANVHLIASAPELLDRLVASNSNLADILLILERGADFQLDMKGKHRDLLRILREEINANLVVIDKAKGRTSP